MPDNIKDIEIYRIANTHSFILKKLANVNKKFIGEGVKYYERLLPLFKGEFPCPICIENLENKTRAFHTIDPEVYFGLLLLYENTEDSDKTLVIRRLVGTPALVSSNTAISIFFKEYHKVLRKTTDVKGYIYNRFNITQEERILNALNLGEEIVAQLQKARSIDRITAIYMGVNFNLLTDLYALSCAEFPHPIHGEKILFYRPRLKIFVDDNRDDPKWRKLLRTIERMRYRYYVEGNHELEVKKKRPRHKKGFSAKEEWAEGW
jgi:hypothetical protein